VSTPGAASANDSITLCSVTLECPDARRLAAFYAAITGGRVTFEHDSWATLRCAGGRIDFQTAPRHVAPTWPDDVSSMQMHLDFDVDDLDATEARVLAAGATKFAVQPNSHCRVFADPAGHPFCLSSEDVPEDQEVAP
jgi:predicted enzyme related to lactoylglutathione lyase